MIDQVFNNFKHQHIAVIGDVMLDTYWWGNTERISPEAPVPVVTMNSKEYRIGGAGNVALNLCRLGAKVSMHSITGTDEDGLLLEMMLRDSGVDTAGVWKSANRLTTNKIRIISRSQHLLRIDHEISTELSNEDARRFIDKTIASFAAAKPAAVIFEDYNKGVLCEQVITELIEWCNENDIITTVDPKRRNFFAYKDVSIFKPNLKEIKEALNLPELIADDKGLNTVHQLLYKQLHHKISLVTLSEKGLFISTSDKQEIIPAHLRNIADVSGAGDTVIAVATLVYATTKDVRLMAEIANIAGGLVCEQIGTVAIEHNQLLEECTRILSDELTGSGFVDG